MRLPARWQPWQETARLEPPPSISRVYAGEGGIPHGCQLTPRFRADMQGPTAPLAGLIAA